MSIRKINGAHLRQMIINGAVNLANKKDEIDELNVFPVPDGDTGTNMSLTLNSGASEVKKTDTDAICDVAKVFSRGLLMGARGNSGVILSQLFRGFAQALEGKLEADAVLLANAFKSGVQTAYKAVMKPVEGTILTVSREAAEEAVTYARSEMSIIDLMDRLISEAKRSLQRTPDLLPVLKEVGVVDSGGAGLIEVYEGFLLALKGEMIPVIKKEETPKDSVQAHLSAEDIEFGYCTEFILQLDDDKMKHNPFTRDRLLNQLSRIGDSIVVVRDEDIVKVHVHTEIPGDALNLAHVYGEFITLKIENMREQHSAIVEDNDATSKKQEPKEFAIITVAAGEGLIEMFEEIGCHYIIKGGQTMNPATEDFLKAIDEVNAKNVIILPNNSNIIMAASQAAKVAENCEVRVVPTKTIPQGYSATLMFNPTISIDDNVEMMKDAIEGVKSGQVTYSVRDTQIDGVEIKKDDYMGIFDKKISVSKPSRIEVTKELLDEMIDEDSEIVTLIYGEDVTDDEVESIEEYIEEKYEDVEVEVYDGKQPVYSYFIAVE